MTKYTADFFYTRALLFLVIYQLIVLSFKILIISKNNVNKYVAKVSRSPFYVGIELGDLPLLSQ